MISIIDFVKTFLEYDKYVTVYFEWEWIDDGIDEEYSFEGSPSDFVEKYTEHYDCLDGVDMMDLYSIKMVSNGCFKKIYMELQRA